MSDPCISIADLRYRYRSQQQPALDGLTLEIEQGQFVVVMGPSGAGKSTLAACLNSLIPHFHKGRFAGNVAVLGRNTRAHGPAQMAELVGSVFQDFESQLFSTTVELEMAFGLENFGVARDEIARRIDQYLDLVGLRGYRSSSPAALSGGQKQKLVIASVLAMQPRLMVLDEPTTDLDPVSKQAIFEILDQLRGHGEQTIVLVEYETEEALRADSIVILKQGKIAHVGPAAETLRQIDLFLACGIRPLDMPLLFRRLGMPHLPLTAEDGARAFQALGWRIEDDRYQELRLHNSMERQQYGNAIIRCRELRHSYASGCEALRGVDLEIRQGEFVAIVGQNGCGKTTLCKHFNGLLLPSAGTVEVAGKSTTEQSIFSLASTIGYVFQNPDHQIFTETIFDEIASGLRARGMSEPRIQARVAEILTVVGLAGSEREDPFSLNKSARQRVVTAAVLALQPEVIILDEPTTGLDYTEQRAMMDLLRQLNQRGSTIIIITHHMWLAAEYAQRVIVMHGGQIAHDGTPREVFAREDDLRRVDIRPPQLVRCANLLGRTLLTIDEMLFCSQQRRAYEH